MNKVMLIGNVGKEPDVHYYDADQAVAQVVLATTEKRSEEHTSELQSRI